MTDFVRLFIDSILALSSIPIHELGHYYSARLMGIKAKVNPLRGQTIVRERTHLQNIIILISGMIAGLIPIFFINDIFFKYLMFVGSIFGGCLFDIVMLLESLQHYFSFNIPKIILKIRDFAIPLQHHKYCDCRTCSDIKLDKMFPFRT